MGKEGGDRDLCIWGLFPYTTILLGTTSEEGETSGKGEKSGNRGTHKSLRERPETCGSRPCPILDTYRINFFRKSEAIFMKYQVFYISRNGRHFCSTKTNFDLRFESRTRTWFVVVAMKMTYTVYTGR